MKQNKTLIEIDTSKYCCIKLAIFFLNMKNSSQKRVYKQMSHGKVTDFETVQSAENILKKIWTSGNNITACVLKEKVALRNM